MDRCPPDARHGHCGTHSGDFEGANRFGDVLDPLFSEWNERDRQPASNLLAHRTGKADPTGFGQRLQPGRDIDAIAKEILPLDDQVPEMNSDPEAHLLTRRAGSVLVGDRLLEGDGAFDRIDRTGEVGHHAIAGGIEDATMMGGDQPIEDRPIGLQPAQGADLILPHEAAVLGDVGRKNYRKLSFDDLGVCQLALLRGAHTENDTLSRSNIAFFPHMCFVLAHLPVYRGLD